MRDFLERFKYANQGMPKSTKIVFGVIGLFLLVKMFDKVVSRPMILLNIGILMFSIILHELGHGLAAYYNGDDTAKIMGRLTLNPIKHIDPLGMLLPIILILTGSGFVIGWAKPVPVNYRRLKKGEFSVFQVSIAGVVMNFILVFVGATIMKFYPALFFTNEILGTGVMYLIRINLILGIFNLLPVPPLDGSKILWSLGSDGIKNAINYLERYGFILIIALSYTGILWKIMNPIYGFFISLLQFYIG